MVGLAQLSEEERELLLQFYRRLSFARVHEKAQAILLSSRGCSPYEISRITFRDEKTVREWVKAFQRERVASLFPRYRGNQNAAKLTRVQKQTVAQVLARPPSAYGLPKQFWEVKSLKSCLRAEFGVVYESDRSYHLLFKLHRYSFHLPVRQNRRRDEAKSQRRMAEIRESITPYWQATNWEILVGDETRLVWEALIRRAWLPQGERTIIKVEKKKSGQSLMGFLNLKSGRPHLYPMSWQNQKETVRVLRRLKREYPGQKLCLIWDNASWHRGRWLRENLKRSLKPFYLLNLPPYSPEANPQEHIWKYAKEEIANYQFSNLGELTTAFRKIVIGRNYPYRF